MLGVVGEPPLHAPGLDGALAHPTKQRVSVPLAPDQRPQIARRRVEGDQPDTRVSGDGPLDAEAYEPSWVASELVDGVLQSEVVAASVQRNAEVVGKATVATEHFGRAAAREPHDKLSQVGWVQQGRVSQRVVGADAHHQALQHHRTVGQPGRPEAVEVVDAAKAGVQLAAPQRLQRGTQAAADAHLDGQFGGLVRQAADNA